MSRKPEIKKCYEEGLINRRALARYLVKHHIAEPHQLEAAIAMLRRFPFATKKPGQKITSLFADVRISLKDDIVIFDFKKEKTLLPKIQKLVTATDYDRGDTLKLVVGSSTIKVFIDKKNEPILKDLLEGYHPKQVIKNISEVSLLFQDTATITPGIISFLTTELSLADITLTELLTASPELLIYVKEEYVLKAYEIIKRLQK